MQKAAHKDGVAGGEKAFETALRAKVGARQQFFSAPVARSVKKPGLFSKELKLEKL